MNHGWFLNHGWCYWPVVQHDQEPVRMTVIAPQGADVAVLKEALHGARDVLARDVEILRELHP